MNSSFSYLQYKWNAKAACGRKGNKSSILQSNRILRSRSHVDYQRIAYTEIEIELLIATPHT